MKATSSQFRPSGRSGMSLIEVIIATTIATIVLGTFVVSVQRESRALSTLARVTTQEAQARELLDRIHAELEYAQGVRPETLLVADLTAGGIARLDLASLDGFPDTGRLLIEPGTASEERLSYAGFTRGPDGLLNLERGQQCTPSSAHLQGAPVLWAGLAYHVEDQTNPPAPQFDGISEEIFGPVFFRGDGVGFAYRLPTDPAGGTDYFDGDDVRWGANVGGALTVDGWSCLYFDPAAQITEVARGADLNGDGDRADTFELGRIRMRSWDGSAPARDATDVALCPPFVLQELCNWGGDLDADGRDDPIFLWNPRTGRLRVRMFVLHSNENETATVRRYELAVFVRNGAHE